MGIEPTQRASRIAARGFEVRGAHQHPFASTGAVILPRACIVLQERGACRPAGSAGAFGEEPVSDDVFDGASNLTAGEPAPYKLTRTLRQAVSSSLVRRTRTVAIRGGPGKPNLLGRSLDLLRGFSGRFQKEAGRAWRLSRMRVEAAALRRQRTEALRRLGEAVYARIRTGAMALGDLNRFSDRVAEIDAKILATEKEIGSAVNAASRRRAASADKAPRESHRLGIVGSALTAPLENRSAAKAVLEAQRPAVSNALPIDPLEDILGVAEEFRSEDLEAQETQKSSAAKEKSSSTSGETTGEEEHLGL